MENTMKEIDKTKPILVTGGTGYLASWIIKMLLEDGIDVHATVRDSSNTAKIEHLTTLANQSSATLKLFDADLLKKGSFEEAMGDCELVFHTASPFIISDIKNPIPSLLIVLIHIPPTCFATR